MTPKLFSLLQKHQWVDVRLRLELSRKAPDSLRVQRLKKAKLAVKDALHALTRRQADGRA